MPATPDQRRELIQQLHAAPLKLVLQVTGGGSLAISDLLAIPGGSRILLAAEVPYSEAALKNLLGKAPEQACSELTARQMAMAAFQQARAFAGQDAKNAVGLACTASLASDRPKRGEHRIHAALQTADKTISWSLVLEKDKRTRAEEERLTADLLLSWLAEVVLEPTKSEQLPLDLLPSEKIDSRFHVGGPLLSKLLLPELAVISGSEGLLQDGARQNLLVFPGSFAPLHEGHQEMAGIAEARTGKPVHYEIAVRNVDKPPLDFVEIDQRLGQFPDPARVLLTTAPTFAEKARLFPGAMFVVGADTIRRIGEPRYYNNQIAVMVRAIEAIAVAGCRFLVFGRVDSQGRFATLDRRELPAALAALCDEVPEAEFRRDVSSTEIRRSGSA
jgi:nicotinamide mononucleotide (NMN) deamidase PncC